MSASAGRPRVLGLLRGHVVGSAEHGGVVGQRGRVVLVLNGEQARQAQVEDLDARSGEGGSQSLGRV